MTNSLDASEQSSGGSAEELYAWARRRLLNGASNTRLVRALIERGLPTQMAEYFAHHIADQTYSERRAHAFRLTMEGGAWLVGSLVILLTIHQTIGMWSAHGPWLLGWAVVACGALRILGGIFMRPRRADSNRRRLRQPAHIRSSVNSSPLLLDFQALGLKRDASPAAIHESYRELARVWHPDGFVDSIDMRMRAEQRMKRINAAYARLSREVLERTS